MPAFLEHLARHGQIQEAIQAGDRAVDAAAIGEVDHRVAVGPEEIAGGDDVGAAEHDHRAGVVRRRVVVIEHDRLAVEREIARRLEVGVERTRGVGDARLDHPRRRVLVRHDRRDVAVDRAARLRDRLVAAGVIRASSRC